MLSGPADRNLSYQELLPLACAVLEESAYLLCLVSWFKYGNFDSLHEDMPELEFVVKNERFRKY